MSGKRMVLTALGTVLIAGSVWAQEPATEEEQPTERRQIKVLENPYDIASFYRSHQGEGFGETGAQQPGWYASERYPIASFYRQKPMAGPYGYSRFWTNGYGTRGRRGMGGFGYARSIGDNGDLYLFAPAILAPVGPLTGVFYEGR